SPGQYRFALASGESRGSSSCQHFETHPTLPRVGTDPGSQLDHLVEASLSKGYQSSTLSWNVLTPSALDARLEPGLLPLIRSTEHSITDRCCHSPVAVRGTARSPQLEHLVVFRLRTQNGSVCLHTHVHS